MSDARARDVIAETLVRLNDGVSHNGPEGWADAILAALAGAGCPPVTLEQVGWCTPNDPEERVGKPWRGPYELIELGRHDGERYGDPPVFRVVTEQEEPKP